MWATAVRCATGLMTDLLQLGSVINLILVSTARDPH